MREGVLKKVDQALMFLISITSSVALSIVLGLGLYFYIMPILVMLLCIPIYEVVICGYLKDSIRGRIKGCVYFSSGLLFIALDIVYYHTLISFLAYPANTLLLDILSILYSFLSTILAHILLKIGERIMRFFYELLRASIQLDSINLLTLHVYLSATNLCGGLVLISASLHYYWIISDYRSALFLMAIGIVMLLNAYLFERRTKRIRIIP